MAPATSTAAAKTQDASPELLKPAAARCNPVLLQHKPSMRGLVTRLQGMGNPEKEQLSLALGDASAYECFRDAVGRFPADAAAAAALSGEYSRYSPSFGYPAARRAVAEYLSTDGDDIGGWPARHHRFRDADVYLTAGANGAITALATVLAAPCANLLLPRPGFAPYDSACLLAGVEPRYYDLLPPQRWEADIAGIRSLADANTVGIVVISPNNPCGVAYSPAHLLQVAETARDIGVPVIADEVYSHIVFSGGKYHPMAAFAHVAPVIVIGSLSKRFMIPGWRLGWLAFADPNGALAPVKTATEELLQVITTPSSIVQGAARHVLSSDHKEADCTVIKLLEESAGILYDRISAVVGLRCHSKPQGSMFFMVEVDTAALQDIADDLEFAAKLMKEESVVVLPAFVLGMKNWVRFFFGVPPEMITEACDRIEAFCRRHCRGKQEQAPKS